MLNEKQIDELMNKQSHLAPQNYEQVDKVTPLSPFAISRQATINIGTIGHVAHGKSTVVKAISGVNTVKHVDEQIRSITIKLGYANAKIYKCPQCPAPECYESHESSKKDFLKCKKCTTQLELIRHVSFVDCPGHDILMATMLTGAAVMDAALLLISAEMDCPQPQTREHFAAVQIMKLDKIIILQNKIDLIFYKKDCAEKNYKQIKEFIKGTIAENSPIVPISAQFRHNIDVVLQYITEFIPIPKRNIKTNPQMIVIRSFDVNKPGCKIQNLKGGIAGGSILQGVLRVGDEIEVRPGIKKTDSETGRQYCEPIYTKITTLFAEKNDLLFAIPGGLIGVGTLMDPSLTKADSLVGNVIGYPGNLPDVYDELEIQLQLLTRLVGVKAEHGDGTDKVNDIQKGEVLLINVGSTSCGGRVISTINKFKTAKISLFKPVCTEINEKVALSRKISKHWRLIGWGNIKTGRVVYSDKKQ